MRGRVAGVTVYDDFAHHPTAVRATLEALRRDGFSDRIIEQFFRPFVGGIQLDPSLQTSRRMFDIILRCLLTGDAAVPQL